MNSVKYSEKHYRSDLVRYFRDIEGQLGTVETTMKELDCCVLTEFEKLQKLVSDAQNLASTYYLQTFLSPFSKEYAGISLAAQRLSEKRHGALIVVQREESLAAFLHNGIPVAANVSPTLIETIFYPGNPLHDGGMLIEKEKIISAGNILPVADTELQGKKIGTRHRAAMGLSAQTDALVIVVSEETGRISFSVKGKLYSVKN
jgi:diadenylate cyclase